MNGWLESIIVQINELFSPNIQINVILFETLTYPVDGGLSTKATLRTSYAYPNLAAEHFEPMQLQFILFPCYSSENSCGKWLEIVKYYIQV